MSANCLAENEYPRPNSYEYSLKRLARSVKSIKVNRFEHIRQLPLLHHKMKKLHSFFTLLILKVYDFFI